MTTFMDRRTFAPKPLAGTTVSHVRLSPDATKLAFVRSEGGDSKPLSCGVYLQDPESGWTRRVASYSEPIEALAWSKGGAYVAYVIGSKLPLATERFVAWAKITGPGEVGRVRAASFAWSPTKEALFVTNVEEKAVQRVDCATGGAAKVHDLIDRGDAEIPPLLAPSPDAKRIAVVTTDPRKHIRSLSVLSRDGEQTSETLITQFPGTRVDVLPFWSPKGTTLAFSMVHRTYDRSGVIALPKVAGEGETLFSHDWLDAPVTPAWSPSGRALVLFVADEEGEPSETGPQHLSTMDVSSRGAIPKPTPVRGAEGPLVWAGLTRAHELSFRHDRGVLLDGGPSADLFTFPEPL